MIASSPFGLSVTITMRRSKFPPPFYFFPEKLLVESVWTFHWIYQQYNENSVKFSDSFVEKCLGKKNKMATETMERRMALMIYFGRKVTACMCK